jgi:hypothetical protein
MAGIVSRFERIKPRTAPFVRVISFCVSYFGVLCMANSALLMPFVRPEAQSNIVVKANFENPIPPPIHLTNLVSNTNLFGQADISSISDANRRFSLVTNIFLVEGLELIKTNKCYFVVKGRLFEGRYERGPFTNFFSVAVHFDSKSQETVEIAEPQYPGSLSCRIRRPDGGGYNVRFSRGRLASYAQVNNQFYDGIYVNFKPGKKYSLPEQCWMWTRFKRGMSSGDFLMWDGMTGDLTVWALLPDGFDFIGNCVDDFDPDWRCGRNP